LHEDVLSVCREAAYRAVHTFDPSRSQDLRTYLWFELKNAVEKLAAEMLYGPYIPPKVISTMRKIAAVENRLRREGVTKVDVVRLATESGVSAADVFSYRKYRSVLFPAQELDAPVSQNDAGDVTTMLDRLLADSPPSDSPGSEHELRQVLNQALLQLTPREERVVRLSMVFDQGVVADHLGCTRQNVSLIWKSALKKMRKYMECQRLRFEDVVAG
jgi:RNA polymerase sigma factor (sigma-70 family)